MKKLRILCMFLCMCGVGVTFGDCADRSIICQGSSNCGVISVGAHWHLGDWSCQPNSPAEHCNKAHPSCCNGNCTWEYQHGVFGM